MTERIVLAFSGGAASAAAIGWLQATRRAEVIAVILDLGQGGDLEAVRDRALALGAARAHVLDVRDEFARRYVIAALKADALYEDRYPLDAALAWPLIARTLGEIAAIEQTTAVAHGAIRGSDEPSPLETTMQAVEPALTVVRVPPPQTTSAVPGVNVNLWGRSVDLPAADEPWGEPAEDLYSLTKSGRECPNEPAYVELSFEEGAPVAINGVAMRPVDLISSLTIIAGAHGVGRLDLVETRPAGRYRRVYEAPAAVVLHAAHRELTKTFLSRDLERFTRQVRVQYADLVCHGLWFTPFREALDAFVHKVQERVTGDVRLRLFKGACRTAGRKPASARPSPADIKPPQVPA
jgi:argininosuccinate synthase